MYPPVRDFNRDCSVGYADGWGGIDMRFCDQLVPLVKFAVYRYIIYIYDLYYICLDLPKGAKWFLKGVN